MEVRRKSGREVESCSDIRRSLVHKHYFRSTFPHSHRDIRDDCGVGEHRFGRWASWFCQCIHSVNFLGYSTNFEDTLLRWRKSHRDKLKAGGVCKFLTRGDSPPFCDTHRPLTALKSSGHVQMPATHSDPYAHLTPTRMQFEPGPIGIYPPCP